MQFCSNCCSSAYDTELTKNEKVYAIVLTKTNHIPSARPSGSVGCTFDWMRVRSSGLTFRGTFSEWS